MSAIENDEGRLALLVQDGKTEEAVALLLKMITHQAKAKRFDEAEALRQRLMAIDEMALAAIIRAAEIIETEKEMALDKGHLETWAPLYGPLTPEETNALFFALTELSCKAGQVVIRQGQAANRLLLPESGHFKLFYRCGDRYRLIQTVEPGIPVGQESVLKKTVYTTFLAAKTDGRIRTLPVGAIDEWNTEMPGLRAKMHSYCETTHRIPQRLARNGMDRRSGKRLPCTELATVQMLDGKGQPVGKPFKGELNDISSEGISFSIKATQKAAHAMWNRTLQLSFSLTQAGKPMPVTCRAKAVAIEDEHFGTFGTHCRLDRPIPDSLIWER
jgi:CRP-like cAMP-binding protein